jgi:hypothetical protein
MLSRSSVMSASGAEEVPIQNGEVLLADPLICVDVQARWAATGLSGSHADRGVGQPVGGLNPFVGEPDASGLKRHLDATHVREDATRAGSRRK